MRTRPAPVAGTIALALALALTACGRAAAPEGAAGTSSGPTDTRSAAPTPPSVTSSPSGHGSHGSPEPGPGSGSEPTTGPGTTPDAELDPEAVAYLALCEMRALVASGDLDRAEAIFHDEIHEPLHELAEELATSDRGASAALLVAKARVEADLEREPLDAAALGPDVRGLQRAMAAALETAGIDPPACPAEGAS